MDCMKVIIILFSFVPILNEKFVPSEDIVINLDNDHQKIIVELPCFEENFLRPSSMARGLFVLYEHKFENFCDVDNIESEYCIQNISLGLFHEWTSFEDYCQKQILDLSKTFPEINSFRYCDPDFIIIVEILQVLLLRFLIE